MKCNFSRAYDDKNIKISCFFNQKAADQKERYSALNQTWRAHLKLRYVIKVNLLGVFGKHWKSDSEISVYSVIYKESDKQMASGGPPG